MHVQSFGLTHIFFLPGISKDGFLTEYLTGMLQKQLQNRKLLTGQMFQFLPADPDLMRPLL